MRLSRTIPVAFFLIAVVFAPIHSVAKDHYYVIPLPDHDHSQIYTNFQVPYFAADQDVKVWVCPVNYQVGFHRWGKVRLAVLSKEPLDSVSGTIYLGQANNARFSSKSIELKTKGTSVEIIGFYSAIESHYKMLSQYNIPGQPWFRYKLEEAIRLQGRKPAETPNRGNNNWELDRALDFFSGSRAIRENLQLNRQLLNASKPADATIDVDSIRGITIKEFDWKPLLKKPIPKLDPLASLIPHDQHAVFLNSLTAIVQILGESEEMLTPIFGGFSSESVDEKVVARFMRQMRINPDEIGKHEFAKAIQRVAVTGSDPYSELGTDIGIIVEMKDEKSAKALTQFLAKNRIGEEFEFTPIENLENSFAYASPDRSISFFAHHKENIVWLTNSPVQMEKLKNIGDKEFVSIADLPEYHFFRQRYLIEGDETAFVFMSDAAIRRWCSPKWRISQARRVVASLELNRLQAKYVAKIHSLKNTNDSIELKQEKTERLGDVFINANGVYTSKFGRPTFVRPIAEMNVSKVTVAEKVSYERWRNGYERNWQSFDPIAIQLKMKPKSISVDMSIVPLILSSDYQIFSTGKKFGPDSGEQHANAMIHFRMAVGKQDFLNTFLSGVESVEFFADDHDTFWRHFVDEEKAEEYFQKNINKAPIGIAIEFDNADSRKRFMAMAKGFLGFYTDETLTKKHRGVEYTEIIVDPGKTPWNHHLQYHYLERDKQVLFALNVDLLKQAIDRQKNGKDAKPDATKPAARKWLGENIALQTNKNLFQALEFFWIRYYSTELRDQTWKNIPILNEWKREFPDENPLEVHERLWGQELLCTGGGKFLWDKKYSTIYSTVFGSPSKPRIPMGTPFPMRDVKSFDAGLSFENDGVRAKVKLEKK